jgi:hypothetical protein
LDTYTAHVRVGYTSVVLLKSRKTEMKITSSLLTLYIRGSAGDNVTLHRPTDPCARGSAVVETVRYKPEGRGIDS